MPLGKAALLLVKILKLLCKGMVSPDARPPGGVQTSHISCHGL